MIDIEKGVPIPARRIRYSEKYNLLDRLGVGDSFVIRPNDLPSWRNAVAAYHKNRNLTRRVHGRMEKRFRICKDEWGHHRCWRMDDVTPMPLNTQRGGEEDDDE